MLLRFFDGGANPHSNLIEGDWKGTGGMLPRLGGEFGVSLSLLHSTEDKWRRSWPCTSCKRVDSSRLDRYAYLSSEF